MRRSAPLLLGTGCALAPALACFHAVLFRGEQFAYRDAGHFYDPLYRVVRQEWAAGRWPLWNPWQNGGTPLLGLPMAAVFYPGKLLYALLPYATAAPLYVLAHTLVAMAGAFALGRGLGLSATGATLAGLSYAFGAPILALNSNVIYLVGAAWIPWGFRAIDRLGRPGDRRGAIELGAVLALQVLGGDPESAYLTAAAGVLAVALLARRGRGDEEAAGRLAMGRGLVVAVVLGAATAAVQIVPAWEYARRSTRPGGPSRSSTYDFSVEPYRLAEAVWPHVFGLEVPENRAWIQAIPPAGERMLWTPSLYVGGFVLVLGAAGAGLRGGPSWRRWLTVLGLVGLAGGLGKFAGPLWWARCLPGATSWLGAHDPAGGLARPDDALADGVGSVYWAFATLLPGFGLFRYPAKLLVLVGLCAAVLAGLGWDRLCRGEAPSRSVRRWCLAGSALSVGLGLLVLAGRAGVERWVAGHVPAFSLYGPVDAPGAVGQTLRALWQGAAVYAAGACLAGWAARRPGCAGAVCLVLVAVDLAIAGARIVWTVPVEVLADRPEVARLIDQAERTHPSPGPFRIHRVEQWHPEAFRRTRSPDRLAELVAWERETLDRLNGEPFGLSYAVVRGVVDLADYLDFFEARAAWGRDERGVERPIYSYPRGGYDLWNARYVLMPVGLNGWMGPGSGFTRVAPGDEVVVDPERARRWVDRRGWQLLRNDRAFPRCWVVASAAVIPPTAAGTPERARLVRTLVDAAGGEAVARVDLRRMAFVEADDPGPLSALNGPPSGESAGSAAIVRFGPQKVEIGVELRRPGLVVLADVLDPSWDLSIDGAPAPIWRTNRLMRGAFVPSGRHTLVYRYRPDAFRGGAAVSLAGLIALVGLAIRGRASGSGWSTAGMEETR